MGCLLALKSQETRLPYRLAVGQAIPKYRIVLAESEELCYLPEDGSHDLW